MSSILNVLHVICSIVIGISMIMIVYGGFRYTTSQGDPIVTEKSKQAIVSGGVGVMFSMIALIITTVIGGTSSSTNSTTASSSISSATTPVSVPAVSSSASDTLFSIQNFIQGHPALDVIIFIAVCLLIAFSVASPFSKTKKDSSKDPSSEQESQTEIQ